MENVLINKEFEDKQSLFNFVSAMLPGRRIEYQKSQDGAKWILAYPITGFIIDGSCEKVEDNKELL